MSEPWENVRLDDLVAIQIGGTPSRFNPSFWADKPNGHPWIAISDLKSKYIEDTREHITDLGVKCSNVKLIPSASTVMSFKLTVGRTGITTRPMYCNEAIAIFLPRSNQVDSRWLYHALPMATKSAVTDTAVKGATLNKAKIFEIRLQLPQPKEQVTIANILDSLDTTIRQTEAIIAKLQQMKQGLLHDLLTRGIDANGQLRPPVEEAPHLYEESPLGLIPKEWEVKPLASYTGSDITYGIVQAGPHIPGGVPYIRTGDMSGDQLIRDRLLCTSRRIANTYSRSEVLVDDIVIAIRATVGKVLIVPPELDGANLTQGTARISANGRTDRNFLLWAIRHDRTQNSIKSEIKGTTFAEITLSALRTIPLAAPIDINEQRQIGERLQIADKNICEEQRLLDKLHAQKSGLMDDLLTGRVRVTPLLNQ